MKTGGELLVSALEVFGVERIFCVPGESYLPVLDALVDSEIETTVCRHEGGAAMMAEAWGKIKNAPGICFATRGPGATNAAAGLHVAAQDSTPLILFVGQIETGFREREAFQEVDYRSLFGGVAKWVAEVDSPDRIVEFVSRAWHVALSGRPGPVVLALPEDALTGKSDKASKPLWSPTVTHPHVSDIEALSRLLSGAKRPIAIVGGSRWSQRGVSDFTKFAKGFELPVACSFRRQMLFDHEHANYAGEVGLGINPKLKARIENSDLVLLVGGRFSEVPSQGYTLLSVPYPNQTLVHVHADVGELGRVYCADLAINACPSAFAQAVCDLEPAQPVSWMDQTRQAHHEYLDWSTLSEEIPGSVQMFEVMQFLRDVLPDDVVLTNGAGNYATWVHRFWRFRRYGTQLAPTSGSMGYGLPAAIAAKLAYPDKPVVAFAGDGCFQMTSQEFGTAMQHGAAVVVIVIDNGIYGTIRMHQEIHYPGRVSATTLTNPDFVAWARSYGAFAEKVSTTKEFPDVFKKAMVSGKPALVHIQLDPEAITPSMTLSGLTAMSNSTESKSHFGHFWVE